jgi:sortase A
MKKYSYAKGSGFRKKIKFLGFVLVSFGIAVVAYVFFPVISYYIYLSSAFASSNYQTPLPDRFVLKNETHISDLLEQGISSLTNDYTDASNWFPEADSNFEEIPAGNKIEFYELSIPKLGINNAKVSAMDTKLSEHLVQYFTTSNNPVEKGTSVIFGHSTLPQLFNPNNYKTIFANLHTLKTGDEFTVNVENKDYTYKIFSIEIVNPTDPNIFSQAFDNSYITLVTCTPPGTVWKRLIVRASLTG